MLWRYGNAGHDPDSAGKVAALDVAIQETRGQLTDTRHRIDRLTRDPALLARPAHRLINERSRWEHDRAAARLAADAFRRLEAQTSHQAAAQDYLRYQSVPRQPDRGPGIGR